MKCDLKYYWYSLWQRKCKIDYRRFREDLNLTKHAINSFVWIIETKWWLYKWVLEMNLRKRDTLEWFLLWWMCVTCSQNKRLYSTMIHIRCIFISKYQMKHVCNHNSNGIISFFSLCCTKCFQNITRLEE